MYIIFYRDTFYKVHIMAEGYFELVVHHRGTFCDGRCVGGDTSTWSCDSNRRSYFEIVGILKEMGFLTVQDIWYSCGGCEELENRLQLLVDDGGAIEMLKNSNTHGEVHLFLVHVVSEEEVMLVLGDVVEPEGVEGDVEDGGSVDIDEDHGMEGVVEGDDEEEEGCASVEPEGVEVDVEDVGGVDIGEHHGIEGVVEGDDEEEEGRAGVEPEGLDGHVEDDGDEVEEDEEEDEGHGGQGIGAPIHKDMECDNDGGDDDGGHVS